MNRLKVFVDGYYDCNFGDDLMVELLVTTLSSKFKVCVSINDNFVAGNLKTKFKDQVEFLNDSNLQTLLDNNIDCYVNIGGSMFPNDSIKEGILRYFTLYKYFKMKMHGIKICIINCSLSWNNYNLGVFATNMILKIQDFITCRDMSSYQYITKYNKNVKVYPDVLFGCFKLNSNYAESLNIGISTYFGHKNSFRQKNHTLYQKLLHIIDMYINKYKNCRILLLSFDGGYNTDLPMALKLKSDCINPDSVEIVSYNGNTNNFINELSKCKIIIGIRFHSIVYSLATDKLCYPIIYEKKSKELLKDLCTNEFFCELDEYSGTENINMGKFATLREDIDIEAIKKNSFNHITEFINYVNSITK